MRTPFTSWFGGWEPKGKNGMSLEVRDLIRALREVPEVRLRLLEVA
jgi:hypothetical protein